MDIYEELNLKSGINAAGHQTWLGSSRMSSETMQAMREAAHDHVEVRTLQTAIHREIARLTNNEAAAVTQGVTSGIYLTLAACISMKHDCRLRYLSPNVIAQSEVMMFRAHRMPYDIGIERLGARLVCVGYPEIPATEEDLEYAITEHTVALLYVPSQCKGALGLEQIIAVCKRHQVPVIVDAAKQLPPKSNLWHYTKELGASAAVFSGCGAICGPQITGVVVGETSLLDWVVCNNFPNYGVGRMNKVGREELCGLYVALRQYMAEDEDAKCKCEDAIIDRFCTAFDCKAAFRFERDGRAARLVPQISNVTAERLAEALLKNTPAIYVSYSAGNLRIFPTAMTEAESDIVLSACYAINKMWCAV